MQRFFTHLFCAACVSTCWANVVVDIKSAVITPAGNDTLQLRGVKVNGATTPVDVALKWQPQAMTFGVSTGATLAGVADTGLTLDLSKAQFMAEGSNVLRGVGIRVNGFPDSYSVRFNWDKQDISFKPTLAQAESAQPCVAIDIYKRKYSFDIGRISIERRAGNLAVSFTAQEGIPYLGPDYLSLVQNNIEYVADFESRFRAADGWKGSGMVEGNTIVGTITLPASFDYQAPFILKYAGADSDIFSAC